MSYFHLVRYNLQNAQRQHPFWSRRTQRTLDFNEKMNNEYTGHLWFHPKCIYQCNACELKELEDLQQILDINIHVANIKLLHCLS